MLDLGKILGHRVYKPYARSHRFSLVQLFCMRNVALIPGLFNDLCSSPW